MLSENDWFVNLSPAPKCFRTISSTGVSLLRLNRHANVAKIPNSKIIVGQMEKNVTVVEFQSNIVGYHGFSNSKLQTKLILDIC